MAGKPIPLSRSGSPIEASFEFFPPKTEEMEKTLWEAIERLAPLAPGFRIGHLRRGRLHARAHACDRSPDRARDEAPNPPRI